MKLLALLTLSLGLALGQAPVGPIVPAGSGGGATLPTTATFIQGDNAGGGSGSNLLQDPATGQIVAASTSVNGGAPTPPTAATSYTIDLATGDTFRMATLTGNTTAAFSHAQHGQRPKVIWTQAAAGGPYTVTYTGISAPQVSLVASQVTTHTFYVNDLGNIGPEPGFTDSATAFDFGPENALPTANCTTGVDGFAFDSVTHAANVCNNGGPWGVILNTQSYFGILASTSADVTINAGATETQVVGFTLPANKAVAGVTFNFRASALCTTTTGTTNSTWRVKVNTASLGANIPVSAAFTAAVSQNTKWVFFDGDFSVRNAGSSGTIQGSGRANADSALLAAVQAMSSVTGTASFDGTVNNVVELTWTPGTNTSCVFKTAQISQGSRIN